MAFTRVKPGIEEVFIILVQDQNGIQKEKWTVLKRDFHKVVNILDKKYGIYPKKNKDLDWALKS